MKEPNYPTPLQDIFCITLLNTLTAELCTDSVILNLNFDTAKRANRMKIFGRLTQNPYEIIEYKDKKIKTVGVVDRIGENIHCVDTTWTT